MIKKIFFGMFIMGLMLTYSCKDEDLAPIITFDQAGKGAYVRLVELRTGEFDLNNISTTTYDADVDFVDIDNGSTVTNYDIYVSYTGSDGEEVAEQLYKAYSASDFGTSANGNAGRTLNIPLSEVAALMGKDPNDIPAASFFNFRTEITSDGVVRNFSNSSSAVNGSAFQGHFNFTVKVTCPVDNSRFSGDYMVSVAGDDSCFGPSFTDGDTWTISTVAGSSTLRQINNICYLPGLGCFDQSFEFDLVCTVIEMADTDTGLSCSAANIIVGGGAAQAFDFDDDSVITLQWNDFSVDGDCGCDPVTVTLTLTKI